MGAATQQHTQARLEASFAQIVKQTEARLNANQMTFRGVMTERADAYEATVRAELGKLDKAFAGLYADLSHRLAELEAAAARPWWQRLLGIGKRSEE